MLLAIFTGCSKDEINDGVTPGPGVEAEGVGDVYLRFTEDSGVTSRAESVEVSGGLLVNFQSGMIFFVDNTTDVIEKSFTIGSGVEADYTLMQLTEGTIFTAIPNNANVVYILANHEIQGNTDPGSDMKAILAETTDLSEQADDNFGVSNVSLAGFGGLVNSTRQGVSREAVVNVDPVVGRIELFQVRSEYPALDPAAPAQYAVTSFKIAGVFINNFYYEAPVYGGLDNAGVQPFNFYGVPAEYDSKSNGGEYEDSWEKYVYDLYSPFSATGSAGALADANGVVKPADNKVWGYNLFPNPSSLPRIVLHLKDVEYAYYTDPTDGSSAPVTGDFVNSTTGDATAYLTVKTYTASSGIIEKLSAGNIYKISDLKFRYEHLTEVPDPDGGDEDDDLNVWVQIKLMNWQAVEVEGGF
ncbi:MAG: hypothetical protein LUG51_11210 [Tannerellaceae bacterium]|nr:hypothetical protein [Tannerellaceae bacterium]